ncbi:MAG: plastocyanin/azurin family copper-binding protein, partial [Chthoniobacterales bacterium]
MKNRLSAFSLGLAGLAFAVWAAILPAAPGPDAAAEPPAVPATFTANVTQHHNHDSRDGLYLDPLFTEAASANLARDLAFDGTIVGNVYAQPLYIEGGPSGPVVIAVTESNNVYALNAITGAIVWQRNLGTAVTSGLPCGNINPLGITATPIVDLASRSLFLNAELQTGGHQIFSLNVDSGAINSGWPVVVSAAVSGFDSDRSQSSRAALAILGNTLYVPYGGRFFDCGSYRGRVVGVQMSNPANVVNFATTSSRAGIWGPGGIASDGTNLFVTTGNGAGGVTWNGSEAVIRLFPGAVFSGATADYWAPINWSTLDGSDTDLGGSGPILVDVPGATPSALVVAIGKDHNAYLLNRANLGGVSAALAQASVGTTTTIQAACTYRTSLGTYVVLRPNSGGGTLTAFKITAANPPTITTGWTISSSGRSSPFVTSTDGTTNAIVWAFGVGAGQRLFGYNGDTGAVVYAGGGANDTISGTRAFNTGIAARGRIYVAGDNKVYSFSLPGAPTPTPTASPTATPVPTATPTATPVANATVLVGHNGTMSFQPASINIHPGDTVKWEWESGFHSVTSGLPAQPDGQFDSGVQFTPFTFFHTFPAVGDFPYFCQVHGAMMVGSIHVTTATPTPTPTATPVPTATPSVTATPVPTATASVTPTATPGPSPSASPTATPGPASQPLNLSTRMFVQTGDNVGIGGFIITGSAPKHLLIRAIGPSL